MTSVKLRSAGLSDELLIVKIKSSAATLQLEPGDLIGLKSAGLSEGVIADMLEAQSRGSKKR